jgi:HD-like signal output (HDOD) protein
MEELWRHSLATGRNAQCIVRAEAADTETAAQAFTAGMLHDIGKLMLAANLPEPFRQALEQARERQVPLWEAERDILGATHADIGASLLSIWGLPVPIVEAVALHHYPARLFSKSFCPLVAVHAANIFEHQTHPNAQEPGAQAVDLEYLKDLGCGERAEGWRKLCLEEGQEG